MRKRTYLLWKRILTRLAVLLVVIGVFYVYFRTGMLTIHSYVIKGEPDGYEEALQAGFQKMDDQKLYKFLPGNRIVSFHRKEMISFIKETLPNTRSVSIHPSGLHTITVTLSSYTPVFRLTDGEAVAQDGTEYHEISLHNELPLLTLATTTQLSPAQIGSLKKLSSNLASILFPVRSITVDEYGDVKLFNEAGDSSVLTNIGLDMKQVWSNLVSAVDTEPLKGQLEDPRNHLLYLDTRFGNKVFYKFTSPSTSAIIPKTNATSTTTTTVQ